MYSCTLVNNQTLLLVTVFVVVVSQRKGNDTWSYTGRRAVGRAYSWSYGLSSSLGWEETIQLILSLIVAGSGCSLVQLILNLVVPWSRLSLDQAGPRPSLSSI